MPVNHTVRQFLGSGKVMLRVKGAAAALRYVGSVAKCDEAAEIETLDTMQHTTPGGGLLGSLQRVKGLKLSIELQEFDAANATLAVRGTMAATTAGTVTDERQVLYPGGYIMLDRIPSAITSVKSADDADTYIPGTDYVLDGTSLYIPSDSTIPSGENAKITYAAVASDVIQGLIAASQEYEIVLDGANEHAGNKVARVTYHRCTIAPTAGKPWINDAARTLTIEATVLQDTSVAAGKSGWYEEEFQQ